MKTRPDQISHKRVISNFSTYASVRLPGTDIQYVFNPNIQLRLISLLIFFNCLVFSGIFFYLNDFIFNFQVMVFPVISLLTSALMFLKSLDKIIISKSERTINITGILSKVEISTYILMGTCSYVKSDFIFARNWPKKTFYLNLADDRQIKLNIGLKPQQKLTAEFESIIQDLSADFNIRYVPR